MDTQPLQEAGQNNRQENAQAGAAKATASCIAGLLIPGLGHALNKKWARAIIFFLSISIMVALGLQMHGRLFNPEFELKFENIFGILKFVSQAGAGLLYWIPWFNGSGAGDPTAYTYDYANLFLYVAGLLNMLVVVDVFDISLGRKQ
jgi:hypothetical protein